jgi:hypothetical protein
MAATLPFVKYETAHNLVARFRAAGGAATFSDLKREVAAENPELARMLEVWCEEGFRPQPDREVAECAGLFVYALLKSQAGADALAEELSGRMG